jgi:hypothetical protein
MLDAAPTAIITVEIDRRAVFDAVLDLRVAILRSIALSRDILDRLAERRDPAPEVRHD